MVSLIVTSVVKGERAFSGAGSSYTAFSASALRNVFDMTGISDAIALAFQTKIHTTALYWRDTQKLLSWKCILIFVLQHTGILTLFSITVVRE